jgi:hypothetical protein
MENQTRPVLPPRPKSEDYELIIVQFLNQLERSRFPIKPSMLYAGYIQYVYKNKLSCKVLNYWKASGDNFGLPPELSIMLIRDSRFIRLEYNAGRDVYYDSKFKKIKGTIKTEEDDES